jgi:hypothetical protein
MIAATAAWSPSGDVIVSGPAAELARAPYMPAAVEERDWQWRGRVEQGDAIEIKGVNGEIEAEPASGQEVEVRARLSGKRSDPDEVEMVVIEHSGGVTICALYPSTRRDEPNECLPGTEGRNNVKNNDVKVRFSVRVPSGVNFVGRTVNGGVQALGLGGDVRVGTVNGDVDVSANGLVEASTVNGSITATMGRADWRGVLDFSTVNGSVTIEMPDEVNADVSISTVNGHITSDYPLTVDGRFSPRHVKGTIGNGGRALVVKTVNGSVQLRKS